MQTSTSSVHKEKHIKQRHSTQSTGDNIEEGESWLSVWLISMTGRTVS